MGLLPGSGSPCSTCGVWTWILPLVQIHPRGAAWEFCRSSTASRSRGRLTQPGFPGRGAPSPSLPCQRMHFIPVQEAGESQGLRRAGRRPTPTRPEPRAAPFPSRLPSLSQRTSSIHRGSWARRGRGFWVGQRLGQELAAPGEPA